MNFLVKHVLVNAVVNTSVRLAQLGAERLLAKYSPQRHAEYVDIANELMNAKFEAFNTRNANLVTHDDEAQESLFDEETLAYAKAQVADLIERATKGFKNGS